MIKSLLLSPLAIGPSLRKYFRSGWAFLIPYLAAYLLYWWLRWPVNPMAGREGMKVASESGSLTPSVLHSLSPPSLLHLYWALHAINLLLAAVALVAWWRERHIGSVGPNPASTPTSAEDRQALDLGPSTLDLMARLAPWLLLGLLFWIPGVYLEFPADPWTHYARINEWSWLHAVSEYPAWNKSSYFLAYSLLGQISPPTRQLFWLDFYYTGCCLLLCWQYYRLARAVGLGERASFIFVLIQALTFGNNIFGFYRYYGISSSIFAQLGAVALIRIGIEVAKGPLASRFKLKALSAALCAACLLALIAFNHVQGLGIAGLGLAAVVIWRLIEWRRSVVFWIAAAAVALSVAAVLWWPRHPALDAAYRPAGWLTAWYGFNVLSPRSLAGDRTMAILGFFGIVNFIAGVFLLRRNHIAGWLTITPLLALCLPFTAIPFANALAKRSVPDILAFHRMLLAIPSGLAIVGLGTEVANRRSQVLGPKFQAASLDSGTSEQPSAYNLRPASRSLSEGGLSASGLSISSLFLLILTAVLLVPANGPHYNRFWNVLMVPASDLAMSPVLEAAGGPYSGEPRGQFSYRSGSLPMADTQLFTTPSAGLVIMSSGERNVAYIENKLVLFPVPSPPSARIGHLLNWIQTTNRKNVLLLLPPVSSIQTPISLTGYLSTHWLPQEMALDYSGNLEIDTTARALGGRETKTPAATYYSFGDWKAATQQSK